MVRGLNEPLQVTLFFPPANEVGEAVAAVLPRPGAGESRSCQRGAAGPGGGARPARARWASSTTAPWSSRAGEQQEVLTVGLDIDRARGQLQRLDQEVQRGCSRWPGPAGSSTSRRAMASARDRGRCRARRRARACRSSRSCCARRTWTCARERGRGAGRRGAARRGGGRRHRPHARVPPGGAHRAPRVLRTGRPAVDRAGAGRAGPRTSRCWRRWG